MMPSHRSGRKLFVLLLALGAAGLAAEKAQAASGTWNGASDNVTYNNSGNWVSNVIPGSTTAGTINNGDTANFNLATGSGTITLPGYLNIDSFSFASAASAYDLYSTGTLYLTASDKSTIQSSMTGSNETEEINAPIQLGGGYTFSNLASAASGDVFEIAGTITPEATGDTLIFSGGGSSSTPNIIAASIGNGSQANFEVNIQGGYWEIQSSIGTTNTGSSGSLLISSGSDATNNTSETILDVPAGASIASSSSVHLQSGNFEILANDSSTPTLVTTGSLTISQNGEDVSSIALNDNGGTGGVQAYFNGSWGGQGMLNVSMTVGTDYLLGNTTANGPLYLAVNGVLPQVILNGTDIGAVSTGTLNSVGYEEVVPATYSVLSGATPTMGTTTNPNTASTFPAIEINSTSSGNVGLAGATTGSTTYVNSLLYNDSNSRSIQFANDTLIFGDSLSNTRGGTILSAPGAGVLTIGTLNDGSILSANSSGTHGGTLYFVNNSSNIDTINSVIANSPADSGTAVTILLAGSGTYAFDGANTYSGSTYLNGGGQLDINNATALGTGSFGIYNGSIDNTSGSPVTLTNNNALTLASSFTFVGSNNLNLGTGAVSITNGITVTVNANTLTDGGVFSGGFVKAGAGTFDLTGASTQTGNADTVNAGTLEIDTAGSIKNSVTVNGGTFLVNGSTTGTTTISGGTLTGSGSTGSLTLNSGGNITPGTAGTATGTLNATSLTFNAGGSLTYVLSSSGSTTSLLNLSGTLSKSGTGVFDINLTGGVLNDTYTLIDATALGTGVTSSIFTAVGDSGTFSFNGGDDLSFTVTGLAVPEPSTWALLLAGILFLGGYGYRLHQAKRSA